MRRDAGVGVPSGPVSPRPSRVAVAGVALVVGLAGGGVIGVLTHGQPPPQVSQPSPSPSLTPTPVQKLTPDTLLAWTPGGLPDGLGRAVANMRRVDRVVSVISGTAWLRGSTDADGTRVDDPPTGRSIPLEVAGADPGAYARFLSPADRAFLPALLRGEALLGATAAKLRGLGAGSRLIFGKRTVRVAGVVSDAAIGAHEILVSRQVAQSLKVTRDRYLLIDPARGASRKRLTRAIRAALPPGVLLRVRGPGETPFFRQGDAVLPPVRLKVLFGEFAAKPIAGGLLDVDPAWVRTHIVTARVPILGRVRCNRALIPQLRAALAEVEREGLAKFLDRKDYAGCYSGRFLNRNPEAGISHHAWGVAFDVNASTNQFGQTPHLDSRVVAVFRKWGFTWGGRWLLPDGMHFEFVSFPSGG
jgi:D-alanyl-D-alanine carboxypeptidase/MacB-like periplasmic core domain